MGIRDRWVTLLFGCGVGFSVAVGWYPTYTHSQISFDPVPVGSLTFSGPSADTLMYLTSSNLGLDFDAVCYTHLTPLTTVPFGISSAAVSI